MDIREYKEDYRKFIISKWASKGIDTFKRPSLLDLENQGSCLIPIIEKFLPPQKDLRILEIGCGWGGDDICF